MLCDYWFSFFLFLYCPCHRCNCWYRKPVWSILTFFIYIIQPIACFLSVNYFSFNTIKSFMLLSFCRIFSSLPTLFPLTRKLMVGICFHAEKSFSHVIVFVCLLHHSSSSWPFPSKLHMIFHSLMGCKAHQFSVCIPYFHLLFFQKIPQMD